MSDGYNTLVSGLEARFDYQSARTMAKEAVAAAGLKEQAKYAPAELQSIVDALSGMGADMDRVWSAVGVSPSGAPAPAAAPEPAAPAAEEKAEEAAKDDAEEAAAPAEEKKPAKKKAAKAKPAKAKAKK